ncbi:prepilin-type N-terminal cleavage/methylation domain-containing protein [Bacillus dakarensis]|uniref:prepilin-type N-terminal cleavage/methylation domain-containing protein n=1 Tax=Robertmurraya dakarensis TaxID=1926278 RepID=UPI000981D6D0|nr:prepilin-type N-terminal cleavage/methylation domain-containing protein [Bacillus dakarensis]
MSNQRGVTLVELLVTLLIMTIISTPIFMLVNNTLKVHQETSIKNELQHEARFITGYMSEKIKDGAKIYKNGNGWKLGKGSEIFISYDDTRKEAYFLNSTTVLSSNIVEFMIDDGPKKIDVKLSLEDRGRTYQTNTIIYYDPRSRFYIN